MGLVDAARKSGKFDFDQPIPGLRALDRYTLQLKLTEVNFPNIRDVLGVVAAVAGEVVEAAAPDIRRRAVGTGAFRLKEWRRGSRILLEANPYYREVRFPESSDPAHAALVRSMTGKTFPQVRTVDIAIMHEDLPRLLQFERDGLDVVALRGEVASRLLANGKLKPEYAARGYVRHVFAEPFAFLFYFNIADPGIGGMEKERIALRRAIAMGFDSDEFIKVFYGGQGVPPNQVLPPGTSGHDPSVAAKSAFDPATARALLERFGYKDRDGDGFREAPDGKPLVLVQSSLPDSLSRDGDTLWLKNMTAIGLRMSEVDRWPAGHLRVTTGYRDRAVYHVEA